MLLAATAISTEFISACSHRSSPKKDLYQRSEKPGGGNSSELALENDMGITTAIGRHRNTSTRILVAASITRPGRPSDGGRPAAEADVARASPVKGVAFIQYYCAARAPIQRDRAKQTRVTTSSTAERT